MITFTIYDIHDNIVFTMSTDLEMGGFHHPDHGKSLRTGHYFDYPLTVVISRVEMNYVERPNG